MGLRKARGSAIGRLLREGFRLDLDSEALLCSGSPLPKASRALPRVALEIFSGSEGWVDSMKKRGWSGIAFDYCTNPEDDILDDNRFVWLLGLIL